MQSKGDTGRFVHFNRSEFSTPWQTQPLSLLGPLPGDGGSASVSAGGKTLVSKELLPDIEIVDDAYENVITTASDNEIEEFLRKTIEKMYGGRVYLDEYGQLGVEDRAIVEGTEITFRKLCTGGKTNIEIDGIGYDLWKGESGWWASRQNGEITPGMAKIHVTGINEAEVLRLQARLIPWLEARIDAKVINGYKTFEPVPRQQWRGDFQPGAAGQASKAFTIYAPQSELLKVAGELDAFLVEKGIKMDGKIDLANIDQRARQQSKSGRVSVVRDFWLLSSDKKGDPVVMLDDAVSDRLLKKYGNDPRVIEKALALPEGALSVDRAGFLAYSGPTDPANMFEFYAQDFKTKEGRSPRAELYKLHEAVGVDPVEALYQVPVDLKNVVSKAKAAGVLRHIRTHSDLLAYLDALEMNPEATRRLKTRVSSMDGQTLRDAGLLRFEQDPRPKPSNRTDLDIQFELERHVESLMRVNPSLKKAEARRMVQQSVTASFKGVFDPQSRVIENLFSSNLIERCAAMETVRRKYRGRTGEFINRARGGLCSLLVVLSGLESMRRSRPDPE